MEHNMITSASGWRKVFAQSKDENDKSPDISPEDEIISAFAAELFADYLLKKNPHAKVILGRDTRPTGAAIAKVMLKVLLSKKISLSYPQIIAAPEIMAFAHFADGFIYISASHNPIGHNGIKFGLNDGGVLNGQENAELVKIFNEKCASQKEIERMGALLDSIPDSSLSDILSKVQEEKSKALACYEKFEKETISGFGEEDAQNLFLNQISSFLKEKPLGIIADMNGSARSLSIDSTFFNKIGINFYSINSQAGQIVHAIIPEPENLVWCAKEMERLQSQGHSEVTLGYMPDCDGDRGNIVYWEQKSKEARVLKAQEVFALSVLSELACSYTENQKNLALAANCPTSMRIEEIAKAFNAEVFRAEVGEANVVNLAREKRSQGYTVRILGEGSNGGNITHPAAVRDPLNTIFALIKLLVIKDDQNKGKKGLFHTWLSLRGQEEKYRADFTLSDIIESLPAYTTTGVAEERAVLKIKSPDHSALKSRFQKIFEEEWQAKKDELAQKYGIHSYEAVGTLGTKEIRNLSDYSQSKKGGLKILFFDKNKSPLAYIWMRGSGTEPVFRVMCDIKGNNSAGEHELLNWEREMILKADKY